MCIWSAGVPGLCCERAPPHLSWATLGKLQPMIGDVRCCDPYHPKCLDRSLLTAHHLDTHARTTENDAQHAAERRIDLRTHSQRGGSV